MKRPRRFGPCKVDEEDLSLIHDFSDVDRSLGIREYPVERRVREECAYLILNRCDCIGAHPLRIFCILSFPEGTNLLVCDVLDDAPAERLVRKEAENIGEIRLRLIEQCEKCVAEDVLHPHSPCLRPYLLKSLEQA